MEPGQIPFVLFHRDLVDPEDPEVARDQALALVELAADYPPLRPQMAAISNRSRSRSTFRSRSAGRRMTSGSLRAASTIVGPDCSRFRWIAARRSD